MEDPENLGSGMAGAGDNLVKQYPPATHQFLEVPFNQLADVDLGDSDEAARFVMQLARLCKQNPSDVTTRTAYAETLLLSGNRDASLAQIGAAYGLRDRAGFAVSARLATLQFYVGSRERATELARETYFDAPADVALLAAHNAALVALWLGDMELLRRAAAVEADRGAALSATDFLRALTESYMAETIAGHQRVVIDCLNDTQAWVEIDTDLDPTPLLIITHYLVTDSEGLRSAEQQIYDGLSAYYLGLGMKPGAYLPYLCNTLCIMEHMPVLSVG